MISCRADQRPAIIGCANSRCAHDARVERLPSHFAAMSVTPDREFKKAMSFLTTLPRERYSPAAFDQFDAASGDFKLGTAKAMAWACQLAYETADPGKIDSIADSWKCT